MDNDRHLWKKIESFRAESSTALDGKLTFRGFDTEADIEVSSEI